jgi:hypothetical protein
MRIGRSILIPVIVALGVAGSAAAGAAIAAPAVHPSSTHAQATGNPNMYYHS